MGSRRRIGYKEGAMEIDPVSVEGTCAHGCVCVCVLMVTPAEDLTLCGTRRHPRALIPGRRW